MQENSFKFFLDFFLSTLIKSWAFLLKTFVISALVSIIIALSIQPTYRADAIVSINNKSDGKSLLGNSLGGLSSLASLSLGLNPNSQLGQSKAKLKSRGFFNRLAQDEEILKNILAVKSFDASLKEPVYINSVYNPQSDIWFKDKSFNPQNPANVFNAYEKYLKNLFISENRMSGLITIGYKHVSPIFSTEFTRKIINEMNNMEKELDIIQAQSSIEYLLQTVPNITVQELKNATTSLMESQLKMKMLASSQKDYLFKLIDGPHIPDSRHAPSRALICISVTLLSMMMAILYLLFFKSLQQYISRLVKA